MNKNTADKGYIFEFLTVVGNFAAGVLLYVVVF